MGEKIDLFRERVDERLDNVNERLDNVETEMRKEFANVRSEMRNNFGKLAKGQELITDLLTRHLGEPDETRADGTDE